MQPVYLSLVLILCGLCAFTSGNTEVPARYKDESFPASSEIFGEAVTCDININHERFASKTWTCKNIRVDGLHLAYGYNNGTVGTIQGASQCIDTEGKHQLMELCLALLKEIKVNQPLWVAFVSQASCKFDPNPRRVLKKTEDVLKWKRMKPGYGYIKTIQCMVKPD